MTTYKDEELESRIDGLEYNDIKNLKDETERLRQQLDKANEKINMLVVFINRHLVPDTCDGSVCGSCAKQRGHCRCDACKGTVLGHRCNCSL